MPALASRPAELALRRAMEARDMAAVLEAFAPDAVLHSPLTDRLAFEGREQIGTITPIVPEVCEDLHYIAETRGADTAFLVSRARIEGQAIEIADQLRLGPDGRILETERGCWAPLSSGPGPPSRGRAPGEARRAPRGSRSPRR